MADAASGFSKSWHGLRRPHPWRICGIYPGDFQAIAEGTYAREGGAHDTSRPNPGWKPRNRRFLPYF